MRENSAAPRDLNHLVHFTQRFRAGLSLFAPAGLDF